MSSNHYILKTKNEGVKLLTINDFNIILSEFHLSHLVTSDSMRSSVFITHLAISLFEISNHVGEYVHLYLKSLVKEFRLSPCNRF